MLAAAPDWLVLTMGEPQPPPRFQVGWCGAVRRPSGAVRGTVERVTATELTVSTAAAGTMTFHNAGGRWVRYGHEDTLFTKMSDKEWNKLR